MTIDRDIIISRARSKYIETRITLNITEAVRMYLERDAGPDEKVPLYVTTPELHEIELINMESRPTCDECGAALFLKVTATDPQGIQHATAWVCKTCGVEYYSELTPKQWLEELRNEAGKQNL